MRREIWRTGGAPRSKYIGLFADAFTGHGKDLTRDICVAGDSIFATVSEKPAVTVIIKGHKTDAPIKGENFSTIILLDDAHVIHTNELFIEEGIQTTGQEISEDIVKDILEIITRYLFESAT